MGERGRGTRIEIAFVVVGVLVLILVTGAGWWDLRALDRTRAWEELASGIFTDVTRADRALERLQAGELSVDPGADIHAPLAEAHEACRVLRHGGRYEGRSVPAFAGDGQGLREELCSLLQHLTSLAGQRLADTGAGVRAAYRARYEEVRGRAAGIDEVAGRLREHGRSRILRSMLGLGIGVLGITAPAGWVVARWRRRLEALTGRHRSLLEASGDAIFGLDAHGRVVVANPAATALTGYPPDELRGRTLDAIMDEAGGSAGDDCPTRRALAGRGATHNREATIRRRDGGRVVVEASTSPVRGQDGVLGAVKVARDVSERRAAEGALRESYRRLAEAEQLAGLGTFEWDPATDELVWSEGLYRLSGLEPGGVRPTFRGWVGSVHPEDRDAVVRTVTEAVESGSDFVLDHRMVRADGELRTWHCVGHVATDGQGEVERVIGTTQDVTELRRVERLKDEFVSVVSHELRTPLTSIHGALGLLDMGALGVLPDRAARLVGIATQNTDRLIRLVTDILDLQRLSAGRISLDLEAMGLGELVEEAVVTMEALAGRQQVTIQLGEMTATRVQADRDRLLQVLTNLLSNAVKFSDPGGTVTVAARDGDGEVVVEVADDGRGIPPDQLESVFGRFQQVDGSDTRDRSGTGLGLAICRGIVEEHGGRIRAESRGLGHGTRVVVRLPADRDRSRS